MGSRVTQLLEGGSQPGCEPTGRVRPPLRLSRRAMSTSALRREVHLSHRSNWLRAAVLGANDGIVSTASLVLGVAASGASAAAVVTAGIAAGSSLASTVRSRSALRSARPMP